MYLIILLALALTSIQADTLKLKNGTALKGAYVGGTRLRIRFEVQDKVQHIPIVDIISLTFTHSEQISKPISPEQPSAKRTDSPPPPTFTLHQTGNPTLIIPAKTSLSITLTQTLNTKGLKRSGRFTVTLTKPVRQNRRVLLPQNTKIYGRVTHSQSIKSGTSQLSLELHSVNIDNHLYTLTTNRIELTCDGDLIAVTAGEPAFDTQTELGDFITPSGEISIPAQTPIQFHLTAPLHIRE
jgi:hypothetical protein